jgi:hypothetical protein
MPVENSTKACVILIGYNTLLIYQLATLYSTVFRYIDYIMGRYIYNIAIDHLGDRLSRLIKIHQSSISLTPSTDPCVSNYN